MFVGGGLPRVGPQADQPWAEGWNHVVVLELAR